VHYPHNKHETHNERLNQLIMAKSANNKQNAPMSASDLASLLTEVITNTFVNLGIVQVNTHPASVPTQARAQAQITHKPSQSARISAPKISVSAPKVNVTGASRGNAAGITKPTLTRATGEQFRAPRVTQTTTHTKPNFGFDSCVVGENRTKLPKGIFEGFDGIILRFADGREHGMNTDVEGRGRLTRNQTDEIGAYYSEGHHLVFERDPEYANVYDVIIWSEGKPNVAHVAHVAPTIHVLTRAASQPKAPAGKTAKKEPTPAQLQARANFAARAKSGEFRKGNTQEPTPTLFRVDDEMVRVSDEDFDSPRTIVAAPRVSDIRVRPLYVVPARKR
jgi:hypothetical protein